MHYLQAVVDPKGEVRETHEWRGERESRKESGHKSKARQNREEVPKSFRKAGNDDPSQPQPLVESAEDRPGGESEQRNGSTSFADRSISARRSLSKCAH